MPVKEMLQRTESKELTEWAAYERVYGKLDQEWDRMVLREIHYELAMANWLFTQKNGGKKAASIKQPERLPMWTEFDEEDEKEK